MSKNRKQVNKGGEGEYKVPENGEVYEANWHDDTPTEEEIEAEELEKGEEEYEAEVGEEMPEELEEEEEVIVGTNIDYEYYGDEKGYDSEHDADGNARKAVTLDAARRIGRMAVLSLEEVL